MSISGPPILLIEPNFHHLGGHYSRYARVLHSETQQRGGRVCVAAAKHIKPDAIQSLEQLGIEVLPLFPPTPYKLTRNRAVDWQLTQTTLKAAVRACDLAKTTRLAWLSGLPAHIEAMALFAEELAHGFLFQLLDFASEWQPGPKGAPFSIRHHLRRAVSAGVSVYAQTRFVADAAQVECDVQVKGFPPILDLKPLRPVRDVLKPRVGLMNIVMRQKDWDAALNVLEKSRHLVEATVHTGVYGGQHSAAILKRATALGATFHQGSLTPEAYNDAWLSLDAVILPYGADYARKGSGMFYESLADAIIPIVPSGTSMAALAEEMGVGLVYKASDADALAEAIATLSAEFPRLAALSRAAAPAWRQANNPSTVYDLIEGAWAEDQLGDR